MGYTISSQVFFTQNYENVLEIYKDLENIRNCENISRIFPESGWRKLLRSETSTVRNNTNNHNNNNNLKYSILDMIPPPRMEIREVLVELQSTVSNK